MSIDRSILAEAWGEDTVRNLEALILETVHSHETMPPVSQGTSAWPTASELRDSVMKSLPLMEAGHPDHCEQHGPIHPDISIAEHIKRYHDMTYREYTALLVFIRQKVPE